MVPAGEAGKATKSTETVQSTVDRLRTPQIRRAAQLAKQGGQTATAPVRYSRNQLSRGLVASTTFGREAAQRLLGPTRSSGQQLHVAKKIGRTDTGSQQIATTPEGQELLGGILARSDSPDAEFFASARVCNSPCGPPVESLKRIQQNVDGVDQKAVEELGDTVEKANRRNEIDIQGSEEFLGNLEQLSKQQDPSIENLDRVIKRASTSEEPLPDQFVKSNLKGEVGTVTAATKVTDGGKTVKAVDKDIETSKGSTDIDVELTDGTAIEVKNFDYDSTGADLPPEIRQRAIDRRTNELAEKLEKYSEESDSVVLATRGDPNSAEIPQEALKRADIDDGTTVQLMNIDDLDQI